MINFFQTFDAPSFVMIHNGPIIVDGFFAIGGLLTCFGLLDQFDKSKRMNFIGLTFVRFLRYYLKTKIEFCLNH